MEKLGSPINSHGATGDVERVVLPAEESSKRRETMRTWRLVLVAFALVVILFGALPILVPPAQADPPTTDPNCTRPCPPFKKHGAFTCTFAGCATDGTCLYAC